MWGWTQRHQQAQVAACLLCARGEQRVLGAFGEAREEARGLDVDGKRFERLAEQADVTGAGRCTDAVDEHAVSGVAEAAHAGAGQLFGQLDVDMLSGSFAQVEQRGGHADGVCQQAEDVRTLGCVRRRARPVAPAVARAVV